MKDVLRPSVNSGMLRWSLNVAFSGLTLIAFTIIHLPVSRRWSATSPPFAEFLFIVRFTVAHGKAKASTPRSS